MKQTKLIFITTALLASLALPASAQENRGPGSLNSGPGNLRGELRERVNARMGSTSPAQMRAEVKARIDARLASSTERRASSTARRIELQQNIANRQAEHAGKKLMATIERLEGIATRVESRIEKAEALGVNASSSITALAEARSHLSEARIALEAFSSVELTSEKLSENFERIRAAGAEVKEHLRLAHQSLVEAIRSLKPGRGMNNATSTRATTTTQ
jgi:ABC-type transporter Mla subunit MlaD